MFSKAIILDNAADQCDQNTQLNTVPMTRRLKSTALILAKQPFSQRPTITIAGMDNKVILIISAG